MANRPSLDSFMKERPPLDSFVTRPSLGSFSYKQDPSFKSEAGRVALQGLVGASQGLLDIGNKPISEFFGGEGMANTNLGMSLGSNIKENPIEAFKKFAASGMWGANTSQPKNISPEATLNSMYGFPVLPKPETDMGKAFGAVSNLVGSALPFGFIPEVRTPTSTGTPQPRVLEETIRRFYDEGDKLSKRADYFSNRSKQISIEHGRKVSTLQASAKAEMGDIIQKEFKDAKAAWAEADKANSDVKITASNTLKIVQGLIDDFKMDERASFYRKGAENEVVSFRDSLGRLFKPKVTKSQAGKPWTQTEIPDPVIDPNQLKIFKNKLWGIVKDNPELEASLMKNYGQVLSDIGVKGFSGPDGVNSKYRAAYEKIQQAKIFSKANINGVASGKITPENPIFSQMMEADKKFGTNYTKRARKMFEDTQARKSLMQRSKASILDEGKALDTARSNAKALEELQKYLEDKPTKFGEKAVYAIAKHYLRRPLRSLIGR